MNTLPVTARSSNFSQAVYTQVETLQALASLNHALGSCNIVPMAYLHELLNIIREIMAICYLVLKDSLQSPLHSLLLLNEKGNYSEPFKFSRG